MLCYHDTGLSSPFRWYYLLSLICCSIRYRSAVAWWIVALHSLSLLSLARVLGVSFFWDSSLPLTLTIMVWVTWACSSLAGSLHEAGEELERLNTELDGSRTTWNAASSERTEALRASQARVIQQEKMAAFGLLAAGIAHEVGNPSGGTQFVRADSPAARDLIPTPPRSLIWRHANSSGSNGRSAS